MLRSWGPAGALLAGGAFVAIATDRLWFGVTILVLCAALAFLVSPLIFPRSVGAVQAQQCSARDGRPIVYWRPGCQYCVRLRLRLGRAARGAYWVNIWSDPAGAAAVRAITGGDETVPTVVANGESVVNPEPGWLRHALRRER